MTDFTIDTANWRDLNAVRKIEQVCFPKDAWPLLDVVAVLTFPDTVRLKAVSRGNLVGFAAGDIRKDETIGWITTICVLPEYRNKGIASALLAACEKLMQMPRIRLCVRRSNNDAIHLYDHRGYLQVSVWAGYYHDGEDALVLEKKLPPYNS